MKKKIKSISFIGAGKLAHSLVPAFISSGYEINSVISKHLKDAKSLAQKYGITVYSDKLSVISAETNIFFISVPDDQLEIIAKDLVNAVPQLKGKYFIHFSGVMESVVLNKIADKGGKTASFHIIQTFPSLKKVNIKNSFASIETSDKNLEKYLFGIAQKLSLNAFRLDPGKKTEYHLASVYASNFLVSNLYIAEKLFMSTGVKFNFYSSVEPIIKTTLANVKAEGVLHSASGPVERGDITTIKKHIAVLKTKKPFLQNYIVQSLSIIEIKNKQGKLTKAQVIIKKYLEGELKKVGD